MKTINNSGEEKKDNPMDPSWEQDNETLQDDKRRSYYIKGDTKTTKNRNDRNRKNSSSTSKNK